MIRGREYSLGSRVGGRLLTLNKREGDPAKKGEVIAHLDPSVLLAEKAVLEAAVAEAEAKYRDLKAGATKEEIEQAQAELAAAEAQYRKALSGFRDEDIRAAQNEVAALESQYGEARARADRIIALYDRGYASENERDSAIAARDALKARRDAALENLRKLTAGFRKEEIEAAEAAVQARKAVLARLRAGPTPNSLAAAEARVRHARALLARLQLDITDLSIVAPEDGFVESFLLDLGEIATPAQPVVTFVGSSDLWIEFYVPEIALATLSLGQRLQVVADPFPRLPFDAVVFFISREAEFTPRNVLTPEERLNQVYRVKARPEGFPDGLRPGMNVTIRLPRDNARRSY